jgi:hypothetical protein
MWGRLGVTASAVVTVAAFLPAVGASAAPSPAAASSAPPKTGHHLSSRLAAIATPGAAHASARDQARVTSTAPSGPGSLLHADARRLLVDIRVAHADRATLARLRAAGARITFVASKLRIVTAAVDPADLRTIGDTAGVAFVRDILTPMTNSPAAANRASVAAPRIRPHVMTCDSTISEGDGILKANLARANHSVDGTGVTVGVLSDSFDTSTGAATHASGDVTSDNLPGTTNTCGHTTPVNKVQDLAGGEDEGRGMAQTIHDLAPGAALSFATAFNGEPSFASNIQALKNAGSSVIVDDVSYFDEPYYQDGIITKAVTTVVNGGATYFSSAANNNLIFNGHNVNSYEAVNGYRPTTCPTMVGLGETLMDCHNFNPTGPADPTFGMTVGAGQEILPDLQWAEPQQGVTTDMDMALIDTASGAVLASSTDNNLAGEVPFELIDWTNAGAARNVSLVVGRFSTPTPGTPRMKFVFLENGRQPFTALERQTATAPDVMGPTIFGHNGAAKAISVAAEDVRNAPNTPVNYYSSRGPVTLLFNPVTGTTTPATPLPTPLTVPKPDVTASDCVKNTFFGGFDGANWRFCGTSDAAPHGAAVAALIKQAMPGATPAQVTSAILTTAAPIPGFAADSMGAGLINADAAVASVSGAVNDFSLAVNPASIIISAGTARSVTLSTAVTAGVAAPITLSSTGQPAGVTVGFSPSPVNAGNSSTVTITVTGAVKAQTKTLTLKGVEGAKSHTVPLKLIVATNTGPLNNGGFETGDFVPWTSTGSTAVVTAGAQAGTHAARVGSTAPSTDSSISQTFTEPATANGLHFYYNVTCPDTLAHDWAMATLTDNTAATSRTVLEKTCTSPSSGWRLVTTTAIGGHNYTLTLMNHDNNTGGTATSTLYDSVAPTTNGIINGGFETGNFNAWTPLGVTSVTTTAPKGGGYDAQLGGAAPSTDSSISSTFTLPASTTKMHFYYNVFCPDVVANDWATATLTDNTTSTTTTVLAKTCVNPSSGWKLVSFPVTGGHNFTLTLTNHDNNNAATPTFTRFDNVAVG